MYYTLVRKQAANHGMTLPSMVVQTSNFKLSLLDLELLVELMHALLWNMPHPSYTHIGSTADVTQTLGQVQS